MELIPVSCKYAWPLIYGPLWIFVACLAYSLQRIVFVVKICLIFQLIHGFRSLNFCCMGQKALEGFGEFQGILTKYPVRTLVYFLFVVFSFLISNF